MSITQRLAEKAVIQDDLISITLTESWLCTLKEKTVNSQRRPGHLATCNKILIAQFASGILAIKAYCRRPFALFMRCAYLLVYLNFSMLLAACSVIPINHSGTYIKQIGLLKNDKGYGADVIRYRPDGKQLAVSGGSNPYVYIYDLKELKRITRFDKFRKGSNGEAISYDGTGRYLVHKGNMVDKSYFGTDYRNYYVVRDVKNNFKIIKDKIQPTVNSATLLYLYPYPVKSNCKCTSQGKVKNFSRSLVT